MSGWLTQGQLSLLMKIILQHKLPALPILALRDQLLMMEVFFPTGPATLAPAPSATTLASGKKSSTPKGLLFLVLLYCWLSQSYFLMCLKDWQCISSCHFSLSSGVVGVFGPRPLWMKVSVA